MKRSSLLFLWLIASLLSACGTTVIPGPALTKTISGSLAVLPVRTVSDIPREKLQYLNQTFSRELSSSGYPVLDEQLVNRICKTPACPERGELTKKFGVSNFVEIELNSSSQANLLAGYYNQVSGTVHVVNASHHEIVSVQRTERESGGLLLNTGLLLQALKSASRGFEDSSHELADRFAKHIIENIPPPNRQLDVGSNVELNRIEVLPFGDSRYRVCATGTPGASARLFIGSTRYALRETSNGVYCNVIPASFGAPQAQVSSVVLDSPFGVSARKDFDLPASAFCDPSVVLHAAGASNLSIACEPGAQSCEVAAMSCKGAQFYVYKGANSAGPFEKVGHFEGQTWNDPHVITTGESLYSVLVISSDGATSSPIVVTNSAVEAIASATKSAVNK